MIAIIKYNAGNATSVRNATQRLGMDAVITDNVDEIRSADKVIFPGVGEASTAMRFLTESGLDTVIKSLQQPVLGVCLGQQLMCRHSEENDTTCLGIFEVDVKLFPSDDIVPHMGWNEIYDLKSPLYRDIPSRSDVYFVHSYYCPVSADTIATCNYILPFAASMHRDNFYATQFHVEKSGSIGEQILLNFLSI